MNKKILYGITSSAAVFVLFVSIAINDNKPICNKTDLSKIDTSNIEELENQNTNLRRKDIIVFNENRIKSMTDDIAGMWVNANLAEEFDFVKNIYVSNEYNNRRQGKIYVNASKEDTNCSKLYQYDLLYYMDGNNAPSIEIIFTKEDKILACMLPNEDDFPNSTISGQEVKLSKHENIEDKSKINGEAFFEHSGYKFYVEARKIDENDFINIIRMILKNIISM